MNDNEIPLENSIEDKEIYLKYFRLFSFFLLLTVFVAMVVVTGFLHFVLFLTSWGYIVDMILFLLLVMKSWKIIFPENSFFQIILVRMFSFTIVCYLNINLFFFIIATPLIFINNQGNTAIAFIGICLEHIFPLLLIYIDFIYNDLNIYDKITLILNLIFLFIYFFTTFILYYFFKISGYDFFDFNSWTIYLIIISGFILDALSFFIIKYHSDSRKFVESFFNRIFYKIKEKIICKCEKTHGSNHVLLDNNSTSSSREPNLL